MTPGSAAREVQPDGGGLGAALVVNEVSRDLAGNLSSIVDSAASAADRGAKLVLFPEAAVTGLVNNDDPEHDLPFGQNIPGPVTDALSALSREKRIWLALGLLERDSGMLYDSAVLVAPDGSIALKYRRLHAGWHGRRADPTIYKQGLDMPSSTTPFGQTVFLICGDLFDDDAANRAIRAKPDLVLCPFARSYDSDLVSQEWWDAEEAAYTERVGRIGSTTLCVNYLADYLDSGESFFGGALAASGTGEVLCRKPIGEPGIMFVELPTF